MKTKVKKIEKLAAIYRQIEKHQSAIDANGGRHPYCEREILTLRKMAGALEKELSI